MFRTLWRWLGFGPAAQPLQAILYTRPGCGLCDEAYVLLLRCGYIVTTVNIADNPALTAAYGLEIPVVEIAGRIRFRGRIDPVLLKRLRVDPR